MIFGIGLTEELVDKGESVSKCKVHNDALSASI